MKKMLLATSALLLSAGVAAADYTISGAARVGITYNDNDGIGSNDSKTQVNMRLRFNFDAMKELDSGVTLGGRIRMQYDQGRVNDTDDIFGNRSGATLNAAYIYAETGGFRVEVGNANTAFDSLATLYNAELGYIGTVQGSYQTADQSFLFGSYESGPYTQGEEGRMGLFASYTVGDLVARVSYINPDQRVDNLGFGNKEELSVSFDYKVGQFSVGAGYVSNAGFVEDREIFGLTSEYALNDTTNIGLQYVNFKPGIGDAADEEAGFTLYGNTKFGDIGVGAFISSSDANYTEDDIAFGIGASYDLGGANLAGTIQKGFLGETYADVGVSFSF